MKIKHWKPLFLLVIYSTCSLGYSQVSNLNIKQDPKLDSLLIKKIAIDRERYTNEYFTLQLYYGNLELATKTLESAKKAYPNIPIELSFETQIIKFRLVDLKIKLLD